jgi:hypothetical protein
MSLPLLGVGPSAPATSGPIDGLLWQGATDFLLFNGATDYIIWQ